jgi:hypothetical protein
MVLYTLLTSDKKENVLVFAENIESAKKSLQAYEDKKKTGEIS